MVTWPVCSDSAVFMWSTTMCLSMLLKNVIHPYNGLVATILLSLAVAVLLILYEHSVGSEMC